MFSVINTVSIHIGQSAKHGLLSIDYVVVLSMIRTERHPQNECIGVAEPFVFSTPSCSEHRGVNFCLPAGFKGTQGGLCVRAIQRTVS